MLLKDVLLASGESGDKSQRGNGRRWAERERSRWGRDGRKFGMNVGWGVDFSRCAKWGRMERNSRERESRKRVKMPFKTSLWVWNPSDDNFWTKNSTRDAVNRRSNEFPVGLAYDMWLSPVAQALNHHRKVLQFWSWWVRIVFYIFPSGCEETMSLI